MNSANLIISGRYLLAEAGQAAFENYGIAIAGDTIAAVAPTDELRARYPKARHLHTDNGLVMPGLVNAHTHAAMSLFRGLADDLPLMTWLHDHIFPAEQRLTGEMVYWGTLLSCAEMIRSGTTSFCDMYLFARDVARAADAAGMRAWLGEVFFDFPSPSHGDEAAGLVYLDEMFDEYREHPRIRVTVNPHSVYTCAPDLLTRLFAVAGREQALYHIHLSETVSEVATCRERYGLTPVAHLEHLGLLAANVHAAHCVQLTKDEIALMAERRVGIAHCLQSNLKLASGIAPTPRLLAANAKVALGTDGSASNNDVDMFSEMTSVALTHKGIHLDPTILPAATVLAMATKGGARALNAEAAIGSLHAGKRADCIVVDLSASRLTPLYNLSSQLVYAAQGDDVRHTIIGGQLVMRDRKILSFDEDEAKAKVREFARLIHVGR
ncbi:MAG: amidohydrolase [Desulfobulbaceae bacterium]|jgi:5-methylthioadenosine/S-adenosylhomocysteine deaminase|nr:amidohydrolase [Desulfobulbaceae bacterium]